MRLTTCWLAGDRCLTDAAWKGCVTVVSGDMRSWEPPELADIMVSELLGEKSAPVAVFPPLMLTSGAGSLGDNELSPECLDGAQNCLKPNGVSIPQEYTSFLAPVTASKLWMCARDILDGNGLDTPYVVKMHCHYQLARSQPLFTFKHPNFVPKELIDNARFASLTFGPAAAHSVVHGFAGFFEARLYGDIVLSTNPQVTSVPNPNPHPSLPFPTPMITIIIVFDIFTVIMNVIITTINVFNGVVLSSFSPSRHRPSARGCSAGSLSLYPWPAQ